MKRRHYPFIHRDSLAPRNSHRSAIYFYLAYAYHKEIQVSLIDPYHDRNSAIFNKSHTLRLITQKGVPHAAHWHRRPLRNHA